MCYAHKKETISYEAAIKPHLARHLTSSTVLTYHTTEKKMEDMVEMETTLGKHLAHYIVNVDPHGMLGDTGEVERHKMLMSGLSMIAYISSFSHKEGFSPLSAMFGFCFLQPLAWYAVDTYTINRRKRDWSECVTEPDDAVESNPTKSDIWPDFMHE